MTTHELIELVISNPNKYYEVQLNLGEFVGTHFITFSGKLLYDTGIDSQNITWKPCEFISYHYNSYWKIYQTVSKHFS